MTMSLNSIVADVFDWDLDDLRPDLSLRTDLCMGVQQKTVLGEMIGEYFDNLSVNLDQIDTLYDLFYQVIEVEFAGRGGAV